MLDISNFNLFRAICKSCRSIQNKNWYKNNREHKKNNSKDNYLRNRATRISGSMKWKSLNKDKVKFYNKKHNSLNKRSFNYKIASKLRIRLNRAIRGAYKAGSAINNLGCSIDELKTYLESKFQPGMTWDNYGRLGWHIDHIKPLCSFNLSDPEEFRQACCYTNLQPLWWRDNLSKGGSHGK